MWVTQSWPMKANSRVRCRGRGTYTEGTVNSITLLKVGWKTVIFCPTFNDLMSPNAPNCTNLHLYFPKKISGANTPDPQTEEGLSPFPRLLSSTIAHRPTFSELPRLLVRCRVRAAQKVPEGDDTETLIHAHTIHALYNNI